MSLLDRRVGVFILAIDVVFGLALIFIGLLLYIKPEHHKKLGALSILILLVGGAYMAEG